MIGLLVLIILVAVPALAQEDILGCCCSADHQAYPLSFMLREGCVAPFYYNNLVTDLGFSEQAILQAVSQGSQCDYFCSVGEAVTPEPPVITPAGPCERTDYNPAPTDLVAKPAKGEMRVELTWNYICKPTHFRIYKCAGTGCNPKTDGKVIRDSITSTHYEDEADLLWNTQYTYAVEAFYNKGEGATNSTTATTSVGDIECWKQYTSDMFCVSSLYYSNPLMKQYLQQNDYPGVTADFGTTDAQFSEAARAVFGYRFNKAFSCNAGNQLSSGMEICAGTAGGICAIDEGKPACLGYSLCKIGAEAQNYFGLYYTKELCEGASGSKKYCYFDRSKSIVDNCYQCSQSMICYDYRSQEACLSDSCGVGYCAWKDVFPSLGIGVCHDSRYSACHLCKAEPKTGVGSYLAFDRVFERCSEEKSAALSTTEYPCFFLGGDSKSCGDVACSTYLSESQCTGKPSGFAVMLDAINNITSRSNDICLMGVCQWMAGVCSKNADGNTFPDCTQTNKNDRETCEKDYFPPETDMVPVGSFGVFNKININIYDRTSFYDELKKVSGTSYITYYCVWADGQPECDINANPFTTTNTMLTIHNRQLMDGQANVTVLETGNNHIKYYTQDRSNNKGIVREAVFYACEKCTGPSVVNYSVEGAREREGVFYTSLSNPVIHADFNVPVTPLVHNIIGSGGRLASATAYRQSGGRINFTFDTATALGEGSYEFVLMAQDDDGVQMRADLVIPISVDTSMGNATILIDSADPQGKLYTTATAKKIDISFSEPVTTFSAYYETNDALADITGKFSKKDDMHFSATNVEFPDGVITLTAEGTDYSGNPVTGSAQFEVNARPSYIWIIEPSYGVSDSFTFPLVFGTLNNEECRYLFQAPVDPNSLPAFETLTKFDETGGRRHTKDPFTGMPPGEGNEGVKQEISVFCVDPIHGMAYRTFNLSVDLTPPKIVKTEAYPNVIKDKIAENAFRTKLTVTTDEETFCRYARQPETDPEAITNTFPAYGTVAKQVNAALVNVSEDLRAYEFAVVCQDLAERETQIATIKFSTDSSQPFTLTPKTQGFYNTKNVWLTAETSKMAKCRYGTRPEPEQIKEFFQESDDYLHRSYLQNLPEGVNRYYITGATIYRVEREESASANVTFTVDATPPRMVYVNDTGPIPADPEYTYFMDHLNARWLGNDSASGISGYLYMVESRYAHELVKNWTNAVPSPDNSYSATGLNLSHDTTYWFIVKPIDAAGNIGEQMTSDGITVDVTKKPEHCQNGIFDIGGKESDLDCGIECPACTEGLKCLANTDCQSQYCKEGVCAEAACDDTIQNGLETGIDCGGACSPCALGAFCLANTDCETGYCINGVCSPEDECFNGEMDGAEADIDCGGVCQAKCGTGKSCLSDTDCAGGARCIDGACKPCAPDDLDCDGIPNSKDDDIDGDGIPNWEDPDDDNDGLCDTADSPLNLPEICTEDDSDDDNDDIPDMDQKDNTEYWCYLPFEGRAVKGRCEELGMDGRTIEDGDLDNDGTPNFLDDDIDGDGKANDEDSDDDNDGVSDELDNDRDNDGVQDGQEDDDLDGMPNDWELANGLNPNDPNDAFEDPDGDGLTNLEEYLMKDKWGQSTDPHTADTDGDGWNDKEENDTGFNPTDPMMHPESLWWLWLLIIMIVLILAVGGYFGYNAYTEHERKAATAQRQAAAGKPAMPAFAPQKPAVTIARPKPSVIKTREEIVKDRQRTEKFERIRGILKSRKEEKEEVKVVQAPAASKEWMPVEEVRILSKQKEEPVKVKIEVSPTFKRLEELKKGTLGKMKSTEAIEKLMVRAGKLPAPAEKAERKAAKPAAKMLFERIKEIKEMAPEKPKAAQELPREEAKSPSKALLEKIRQLKGETPEKAKAEANEKPRFKLEIRLPKEKGVAPEEQPMFEEKQLPPLAETLKEAREQAKAMKAFGRLRVVVQHKGELRKVPMSQYTEAERQKMMERLLLLRTGKLESKGKEELFKKLKIEAKPTNEKTAQKQKKVK